MKCHAPPYRPLLVASLAISTLFAEGACHSPATPQALPPPPPPLTTSAIQKPTLQVYPFARRAETSFVSHGVTVHDPFQWLEDEHSQEVQAWQEAEERFAHAYLDNLSLREELKTRLHQLLYSEECLPPIHRRGHYFYLRRGASEDKRKLVARDSEYGPEKILVDPGAGESAASRAIEDFWVSPDARYVAYTLSDRNSDAVSLQILDAETGATRGQDAISTFQYGDVAWSADSGGFFYTYYPRTAGLKDEERLGLGEIRFHHLGSRPADDATVVAHDGDRESVPWPMVVADGKWLLVGRTKQDGNEKLSIRPLGSSAPFAVIPTQARARYYVSMSRDAVFVTTTEGASRGRVFRVEPGRPERANWKETVAERADATLEDAQVLGGRLVLRYTKDVATFFEIRDLDGSRPTAVALPGIGSVFAVTGSADDEDVFYRFRSYTIPPEVRAFNVRTGTSRLFGKMPVRVDASPYQTDQVFFASKDGTRVPMFVVHRKDVLPNMGAPAIITGYGGFGVSMTPNWDPSVMAWLEHGGIFAEVQVRGGGEYGDDWHHAGMLMQKQNSFDDFISGAEQLIRTRWTSADRLVARGESNGGLLVAGAMTQRPDLFAAVIARVPLTDMLRFASSGFGRMWAPEYGSVDDPAEFAALYAYSPYHHVTQGVRYPAVLVLTADNDDRVDPMHSRKFVAALQAATTGGPVLMRLERDSGHLGADKVQTIIEEEVDAYAFALAQVSH